MNIAIIKYNAGNIRSVDHALKRLGFRAEITDDPDRILSADKVIFPGVGEAANTMAYLKERELDVLLKELKCPVLGICLGQQLMCSWSEEGDTACIGIFDQPVRHFPKNDLKVPHMGWNSLELTGTGRLFDGIDTDRGFYFLHSYYFDAAESADISATVHYGRYLPCGVESGNVFGMQFHPEKSHSNGMTLLANFAALP